MSQDRGRTLKFSVRNLSFTLREMRRHGWVSGKRFYIWAFLVAQTVKNLPAIQETQVRSPVQEDPLGKGMAIHSSILAWRISWIEEPGGLYSMGSQRVGHNRATNTHIH